MTLQADNADGLQLGDFAVNIPDAFFGPVEIKDISLTYSRPNRQPALVSAKPKRWAGRLRGMPHGCAKTDIASGTVSAKVVVAESAKGLRSRCSMSTTKAICRWSPTSSI